MKVRGFQVAPAELEGHLLDHPDVSDVCVVPIPDEFSGELPFAYIVIHAKTGKRIEGDPQGKERLKAALMKVLFLQYPKFDPIAEKNPFKARR